MVALAFEQKEQLPVRNLVNSRRAYTKRRLEIMLPQIIGFPDMAVDIDHSNSMF